VMTTDLAPDEIIQAVRFPCLRQGERQAFEMFSRRHGDFAIAACAVSTVLVDNKFSALRIGLGGVGDVPLVLTELAAQLVGEPADAATIAWIGEAAAAAIEPHEQTDISIAYRRELVRTLTVRALQRSVHTLLTDA
jgi:carbon-monoxide dehydrogenase medium subunit